MNRNIIEMLSCGLYTQIWPHNYCSVSKVKLQCCKVGSLLTTIPWLLQYLVVSQDKGSHLFICWMQIIKFAETNKKKRSLISNLNEKSNQSIGHASRSLHQTFITNVFANLLNLKNACWILVQIDKTNCIT